MKSLLFLCHRIPYPPNKGDKIRSYNILKYLNEHFDVHLGAFVDDPNDFQYESDVADMCASHCLLPLDSRVGKLKGLSGFIKGVPLGLPYFANSKMQRWVNAVIAEKEPTAVLVFSSTMAQYVAGDKFAHLRRYIDFIDIDSDKWAQYKDLASPIMKLVYAYEAHMLFGWERKIVNEFEHSFFVSEKEAELFRGMVPEAAEKVSYFNNGVDTELFSPQHTFASPYREDDKVIVFTGVMDCWTNVDAVDWFASQVLPAVCDRVNNLRFYIVGAKPDSKVKALAASPHVEVTGMVSDVRPYLAHASVAVAPMRIARGVQNKVLEAMAMALPVVCSPLGYEGINAVPGRDLIVANNVADWVDALVDILLNEGTSSMGLAARQCVKEDNYCWQKNLMQLKKYLDGPELSN
ncbi:TIGR03087 family PEP-CTERM/XrtA system glycosyltransferase [Pseudomonadota bacterium]